MDDLGLCHLFAINFNMSRFRYPKPQRSQKPWIIIVCDGKNTEPQYFTRLRDFIGNDSPVLLNPKKDIIGTGYNRLRTIKECIKVFKERKRWDDGYIEAWCVFDGDPKRDDSNHDAWFVEAVWIVVGKNRPKWLHGAYSFEAFEYWFLLHFEQLDGSPMSRDDYIDRLNHHLKSIPSNVRYDKDKKEVSEEFFQILIERVYIAIANAEKIDNWSWEPIWQAHERNSITKVYKLVKRILWK